MKNEKFIGKGEKESLDAGGRQRNEGKSFE